MKIAFYGSSLLSSYWNGAATYYRGLLEELAGYGHEITFYEPDAFDRQKHRDMEPPDWAKVVVYEPSIDHVKRVLAESGDADVIIKASGVGVFDDELLHGALEASRPEAIRVFWDVDAPATLAAMRRSPEHPLRRALADLDVVLTYGGGPPVVGAYQDFGARRCVAIYNALDPKTHHSAPADPRFVADLAFLGNRLPDREARVDEFFFKPARLSPKASFLIAGNGWNDKPRIANIRTLGHVYTHEHNAFNCSSLAVLNVARSDMAETGYSPATRVFEAAGAGACIITDAWKGIELFLEPEKEVLVAADGVEVAERLSALTPKQAQRIGAAGRSRILAEHTYAKRGLQVNKIFLETAESKRERNAA